MKTEQITNTLKELNKYGFHIEQIDIDKFMCYDTGLFGFRSDEEELFLEYPFIVDGEELLEIYENYIN
jgi:hypothetical protein